MAYFPRSHFKTRPIDLSLCMVTHRPSITHEAELILRVERGLKGGVTCIQLRDSIEEIRPTLSSARKILKIVRQYNRHLIINNRPDVAFATGADGCHFGQTDFPCEEARQLLGNDAIIGQTVDCFSDVVDAEDLDIDYLGVQIFASQNTKKETRGLWGLEGLEKVRAFSRHRLVVIGLQVEDILSVSSRLHPGDGVAMVGQLWRGPEIEKTAMLVRQLLQRGIYAKV